MTAKLKNQNTLTHINHLEELLFSDGKTGFDVIKTVLKSFKNNSNLNIRVKIDGSPSVICGHDPKGFFVSTKSFFNKEPKLNFTVDDIRANHESTDLQNKLFYCLKYLPNVIPNNGLYYQGDLLFIDDDLKEVGNNYQFKQNILTYQLPKEKISDKKLGMCFHTQYENDVADYIPSLNVLKNTSEVFLYDNTLKDTYVRLTVQNLAMIEHILNYNLSKELLSILENNSEKFISFFNNIIKSSEPERILAAPEDLLDEFSKEVNIEENQRESYLKIFKLHRIIVRIKNFIISKLNTKADNINVFYDNKDFVPEGFVVTGGFGIVKLVDRTIFSHLNFNKDI